MTGLILKDFMAMKKTLIQMMVLVLLFSVVYGSMDSLSFAAFFIAIMTISIIISTMSYDEYYHWDRYAAVLPLSCRQIVGAKYAVSLLLFLVGTVLAVAIGAASMVLTGRGMETEELVVMAIAPILGLLGTAVVIPCYYRFGAQKSRFVMLAMYGIPSVLLVLVLKLAPELLQRTEEIDIAPGALLLGGAALTVLALAVSFLLSVRIVGKKELK